MQLYRYDQSREEGFSTIFLTKGNLTFDIDDIYKHYIDPIKDKLGDKVNEIVIISIYDSEITGKTYPVKKMDKALEEVYKFIEHFDISFVYIIDKDISNRISMDKSKDMRDIFTEAREKCIQSTRFMCGVNYKTISRTPSNEPVLEQSLHDLVLEVNGVASANGSREIVNKLGLQLEYPETINEVEDVLNKLLLEPMVSFDIETYSLRTELASVATISFSPDKKTGYSFTTNFVTDPKDRYPQIKPMLREFFEQFSNTKMAFNSLYEGRILSYELFMEHPLDILGARKGINTIYNNCEDPLLLEFCLRNSSIKPEINLKALLYRYFGNYGINVEDITKHSKENLLYYGNLDSIGLHWLFPDQVKEADSGDMRYYEFLKKTRKVITEAELFGMHMDLGRVKELEKSVLAESEKELRKLSRNPLVISTENYLAADSYGKNFSNKRTVKSIADYRKPFNPNSGSQVSKLLYDVMDLPVLLKTEKGNPSTDKDTLKMLGEMFEDDPVVSDVITNLQNIAKHRNLVSTFIPAYYNFRWEKENGGYLCGNLNIIGTQSGRLSSSSPNMTHQPTDKNVLECFTAPEGWLIFSSDFSALEDRGSAIKTNDPNKIVIFEKGLEAHSFKASFYFEDLLPPIDRYNNDDLLRIKNEFPQIRDDSKPVTFGKTYGGGDKFLIKKGYSPERIEKINKAWSSMFYHSLLYEKEIRQNAERDGYIELLFGLKLRTPVLHSKHSTEAQKAAEFRSIYNAKTQCFGMLNSRAAEEFLMRVRNASLKIQEGVIVNNLIHDNILGICKNDPEIVHWINENLIECMAWQNDEYIRHDIVKLTSELDIGYDWARIETIPNNASMDEVIEIMNNLEKGN